MIIRIGSDQEKQEIMDRYPATIQVMNGEGYLIVAIEKTEIIGFAFVFRRQIPAPIEKTEDFINVIEVFKQEHRRQGVASAIIEVCLKEAKAKDSYQVRAYSDINNIESHKLWVKNHFAISPVKMKDGSIYGSFVTYKL